MYYSTPTLARDNSKTKSDRTNQMANHRSVVEKHPLTTGFELTTSSRLPSWITIRQNDQTYTQFVVHSTRTFNQINVLFNYKYVSYSDKTYSVNFKTALYRLVLPSVSNLNPGTASVDTKNQVPPPISTTHLLS